MLLEPSDLEQLYSVSSLNENRSSYSSPGKDLTTTTEMHVARTKISGLLSNFL